MNFTINLSRSPDKKWGALNPDGKTWNGLVGVLIAGKADLVPAPLIWNSARDAVIDFTVPILEERFTLVAARGGGPEVQLWVYMEIFPVPVWFVGLGAATVLALGFYLVHTLGPVGLHEAYDSEMFSPLNGMSVCILLLIQESYPLVMQSAAARLLFMTTAMWAYLVFSYYESDLTARMTSVPPSVPIRSFEDVITQDYKVLAVDSTATAAALETAGEGTAMRRYYDSNMEDNKAAFVSGTKEGKERVAGEPKTLLFESDLVFVGDKNFEPLKIIDGMGAHSAWALQKGSEFTDVLNYNLQRMFETGTAHQLYLKWTYLAANDYSAADAISLTYENTLFPFGLLATGLILAACALCAEGLFKRLLRKHVTQPPQKIPRKVRQSRQSRQWNNTYTGHYKWNDW